MRINVKYNGKLIVENVMVADSFWPKLTGYMFRSSPHVPGIMFEPCQSIQTTFMLFPLDLVFLDKNNYVVKVIRDLKPWRFTLFYFKARKTLELPLGFLPSEIKEGEMLEVINV